MKRRWAKRCPQCGELVERWETHQFVDDDEYIVTFDRQGSDVYTKVKPPIGELEMTYMGTCGHQLTEDEWDDICVEEVEMDGGEG